MNKLHTLKGVILMPKLLSSRLNPTSNYRLFCQSISMLSKKWSYVSGHSEHPLIGSTLGEALRDQTHKNPNKTAFIFPHQQASLTFEQLLTESDRLAAGLMALGTKRGERVGIWSANCKEWIVTMFAAARAGFILVNINSSYQPAELEHCLKSVGVNVLVMMDKLKKSNNYEKVTKICPTIGSSSTTINDSNLPDLKHVIMIGANKCHLEGAVAHFYAIYAPDCLFLCEKTDYKGTISFSDVETLANDKSVKEVEDMQKTLQFDDDFNIQFTSGTTGKPKGATLTHHNILNNSLMIGYRLKFHENETRICSPVPLFHTMGMVMASLQSVVHSCSLVIPSLTFSPMEAMRAVHNERCTTLIGTPTMYIDFLNLPNLSEFDLSSLHNGICAGSVCPEEVMRKCVNTLNMKNMANCYGTTENSPITFQSLYDDTFEKRVSTVGKVQNYVEAKVVDEGGELLGVGESGELWTRGYMMMKGYWQDEQKTKDTMHGNWYKTGDLAVFDEEGYCKIIGRKKDMIIRGGENVYPAEIEEVLYEHPNVKDVQIIGVPDERLGEQVAAWIILKDKENTNEKDIVDYCKEKMAYYKVPKYISFVDTFPMTATGKIQKFKIREEAIQMYNLK